MNIEGADKMPQTTHTIRIGVIAPNVIGEKIRDALGQFPTFVPSFKISDNIYDSIDFTRELNDEVEVMLFSGYSPYKLAKDHVKFQSPAHYIPLTGNGLYRSLYRLKKKTNLKRLSVDTFARNYLEKVLSELNESIEQISYFNDNSFHMKEEMIRFHYENCLNHQGSGAITGIRLVSEGLDERGVANEWVIPTYDDIVVSLERALLSTETRKHKESQMIIGLIKVDGFSQYEREITSESQWQKWKLNIYRMLLEYVECLDGYLTSLGGDEYLFMTTRGIFERETRGYKTIPILKDSKQKLGVSISMGIGFGYSANQAGTHARMALRQSKDFGGNTCFIVRENRSVFGPVEMTDPLIYDLSVTEPHLLEKAEKAGITASYLSKLMAQVKRLRKTDYTALELSSIFGITIRSTHRILLQLLDAELVEIVGEEKLSSKGRPRRIYRLLFMGNADDH